MIARLNNYIETMIETLDDRWPGLVYALDIVNEAIEEVGHLAGRYGDVLGELILDPATEEIVPHHALVLLLKLIVGEAGSLAESLAGAVVAHIGLEVIIDILVNLFVGDLDAVYLALMDEELSEDKVLEHSTAVVESVGGALFEANLSVGTLDVGVLDDIAANNSGDTIDEVTLRMHGER